MADTRMAGDALAKGGRHKSQLEQRLGTDEFRRIGAEGQQDPTSKDKWSAAEVIAEFRNKGDAKVNEGENSIVNRFKEIQKNGGMFNKRAQNFLSSKYGFDFTKNNTNDGNATDGTNTGGDPSDNSGGGNEPGDGGVTTPPSGTTPPSTESAVPGTGGRGGDASNENSNRNTIGDLRVNGDGNNIDQSQVNNNFQQSFGGSYRNFTYNGGGGSSGGAPSAQSGLYDTPASMATMAGFWGADDSAGATNAWLSKYIGGNNFHQAAARADYNARTDTNYKAQADSMNQFNPLSMQERLDMEPGIDRSRADVNFANVFGDTRNMNWDWQRTTAPEPIENDLDEISEEYKDALG